MQICIGCRAVGMRIMGVRENVMRKIGNIFKILFWAAPFSTAVTVLYYICQAIIPALYFLGYLIVNSIQMGANIDYAIVISSHYTDLKKEMRPKEAIIAALNEAFPTIFTSGTILAVAGALIGVMTTNPVIAAIGTCLGRGTVISIVLVMAVLPQILLIGDTIVERTSFDVKVPVDLSRVNRTASGNMRVSGRVRGYVNGVIDAEIKGTLNGTLKASVTSGTTIEPTKPDFYLPESKEQAAAEWAENYTEGEEV